MTTRILRPILTGLLTICMVAAYGAGARAADADQPSPDKPIRVTIYPILVKAPIFGASIDLPSLPSTPGGGGGEESGAVSESTDLSLNAAYMAGFLIEANRWFLEGSGTWAAVSATRSSPLITVTSNTYFYTARGGVRIAGGLSATAGVRRATIDLDATLTLPISGRTLEGKTKPGVWDPLIGADYRHDAGKWTIDGNFQGGGFGVGTDVDLSADVHARWRMVKHLELRFGYTMLYFKDTVASVSIGSFQRTLIVKQSLNGPEFGLGIVF